MFENVKNPKNTKPTNQIKKTPKTPHLSSCLWHTVSLSFSEHVSVLSDGEKATSKIFKK